MNRNNILAGLGGALVLTLLNEALKGVNDDMPRIDLIGEEAVQKITDYMGMTFENEQTLFNTTLVADVVSNAGYYSLITGEGNKLWINAASMGIMAGIGAVKLPEKLGLDEQPVAKSNTTKIATIGYYLAGALTTAAILKFLEYNNHTKSNELDEV